MDKGPEGVGGNFPNGRGRGLCVLDALGPRTKCGSLGLRGVGSRAPWV
jgi:hypothetical protein